VIELGLYPNIQSDLAAAGERDPDGLNLRSKVHDLGPLVLNLLLRRSLSS